MGGEVRVAGGVDPTTDGVVAQLRLLQQVAVALVPALTEDDVADIVLGTVGAAVGAVTSTVWLADGAGENLFLAHARDAAAVAAAAFATIPLGADLPGPHVVRTGEAVFVESRAERDGRWPILAGTKSPSEALAVLPLATAGRPFGVVAFGFADVHSFAHEEQRTLLAIADQCAMALERARLHDQVRAKVESQELLVAVSELLHADREWADLAQDVTAACVPAVADTCALHLRKGNLVRRVATASANAPEVAAALVGRFAAPTSSRAPLVRATVDAEVKRVDPTQDRHLGSADPEHARLVQQLEERDVVIVPLLDAGRAFAAMEFAYGPSGRRYDDAAIEFLTELSGRIAAGLLGAQDFARKRAVADVVATIALPTEPPDVPGVELAASYVPFTSGAGLGGDWWDWFLLDDDRVALVVGDVAGHGVKAAASMVLSRHALRVFLYQLSSPAAALAALDALMRRDRPGDMVTAVAAVLDVAQRRLSWASAGHPLPLVVGVDGAARYLTDPPGPPLGVTHVNRDSFGDHEVELAPGETVYLFTDGLVETRQRSLAKGFERLIATVADVHGPSGTGESDLDHQCEAVMAAVVDTVEDDICLLGARLGR